MTLRDYAYWNADGRPYTLCTPERAYVDRLRGYGYVVYHYPDDAHLTADKPEDHTPFSHTGWPGESPYGTAFASDTMPDHIPPGCPTLPQLARQIIADKNAGVPGTEPLKYMNWTDEAGNCWHDSWEPEHEHRPSTDKGHIHRSDRTDYAASHIADAYDPVARWRAGKDEPMIFIKQPDNDTIWLTNGMTRRGMHSVPQVFTLAKALGISPTPTIVADATQFGPDVEAPSVAVTVDPATLTAAIASAAASFPQRLNVSLSGSVTGSATPVVES